MAPQAVGTGVTIMNLCRAPVIGATLAATRQCLRAQKCGVSRPWRSGWPSKTKALCIVFLVSTLCASPSARELEEVVILGARNELSQALSGSTNVPLLARDDQVSLDRTIADWLAAAPGISLNGQGGLFQSYSLRGLSRARIRTEIDGVPIVTDRPAGNAIGFLPPFLLQSVSGVMGPVSALYGSEAMGGVITVKPQWFSTPVVSASVQTNDAARSLSVGAPLGAATSLGWTLRRANDAEAAKGEPLHSQYRQTAVQLQHRTRWNGLTASVSALGTWGRDIGKSSKAYPDTQVTDYPHERHSVLKFELAREQTWLWRGFHHAQDWQSRSTQSDGTAAENQYRAQTVGSLFYLANDLAGGTGRMGLEWVGRRGVEIRYQERDSSGDVILSNTPVDGQQDNAGLFVDHEWRLGSWHLGMGFRFDHISQTAVGVKRRHSAPSASLRLDGQLSPNWMVYANAGSGFRFPTLSELYYRGITARGAIEGNPALERERSRAAEVGVSGVIGMVTISMNAYRTKITDYIERYTVDGDLRSYRNLSEGTIKGYEFTLDYRPSGAWQHRLSYQRQTGDERVTGDVLADLNPPGWRYLGKYQHAAFSAAVDVMHRPERSRHGPGEVRLDATTVANLRLAWDINAQWQWSLACLNCSDKNFYGSADDLAPLQPGRTFSLGVTWTPGA